jgi:hypothetical protein
MEPVLGWNLNGHELIALINDGRGKSIIFSMPSIIL